MAELKYMGSRTQFALYFEKKSVFVPLGVYEAFGSPQNEQQRSADGVKLELLKSLKIKRYSQTFNYLLISITATNNSVH